MAFLNSRLQYPIDDKCQFCEESVVIWNCINCQLFLCELCSSKLHSKIESNAQHYVINCKDLETGHKIDGTTERIKKVSLQSLKCSVHSEEQCCMFCNDCHQPICLDCVMNNHQNHKYQKLEDVFDDKFKVIKDVKHKIESYIPYFREEENKLQKIYTTGQNTYQNSKDKIISITDDIVKYSESLQIQLDKQWMPAQDIIRKELLYVGKRKNELIERKNKLEQTLTSPHAFDVLALKCFPDEKMPDKDVRHLELKEVKFVPGRFSTDALRDSFGFVNETPNFQIINSYETCLKTINKIIICENNSAFIGSYDEQQLLLVKINFEHRAVKVGKRVTKLPVYDMTMMNNGDLLISTRTKDLKLYTKDGVLSKFRSFPSFVTLAVHVGQCDEILVVLGTPDSFVNFSYDELIPFDSRIEIMNLKGDTIRTIKYSDESIYPSRICTFDNFIYVINDNKLLVLDKLTGSLVNLNLTSKLGFEPSVTDLTLTSSKQILILNDFGDSIYVLSPSVQSFDRILLKDLSISYPSCLHVSADGLMLIGTGDKRKRSARAQIYAIKIT